MNLRSIDLNLLPVFEAIYAERSLTRASEALHITQPAVSNALARLRRAVDDPLFVRTHEGMAPTPAAQALIGPVREALGRLRSSLAQRARFDPAQTERIFTVSASDTAAAAIAPQLLKALGPAPRVRFHWVQTDRADVPGELASGQIDFAIDVDVLARPELDSASLFQDRYVCALRKDHPKARRKLSLAAFLALPHIAVSSRRTGRSIVDMTLAQMGEKVRPVMRFRHFLPAFHVVMASDVAVVAPRSIAQRYDVAVCDLPFDAPALGLSLFWRRDAAHDSAIVWARDHILAASRSD
jgi:DNA-binding transcriptional LysR family regulator